MSKPTPFNLAGEWITSSDIAEVINPANGKVFGTVCRAEPSHIEEAISAADDAAGPMASLNGYEREEILVDISNGLVERSDDIAKILTGETGKTIRDAKLEVSRTANTFKVAAEEAKRIGGEVVPLDWIDRGAGRFSFYQRFPIGPIFGITPFNFPVNLAAHKIAPAFAAGNPIIIKPTRHAPKTTLALAEIINGTSLPKGAFSVLPSSVENLSPLISDDRIKMITFTGSAEVGWELKAKAGKKRVTLELGGIGGVALDADSDLDTVILPCVMGAFVNAGQVCISIQRILIHESIFSEFCEAYVAKTESLVMGDPTKEETDIGPLVTEDEAKRVASWVDDAVASGAKVLCGGERKGAFYTPTVLVDVPNVASLNCNEVFGPVVVLKAFKEWEEAISEINNSSYGLQAGVFTNDLNKAFYAYRNIDTGAVMINDTGVFRIDHMPYGGVKDSGFGREGLKYAIEEMTEMKLAVFNGVWK